METAVCDTSSLSRLHKGNILDCLGNIFHKIYIPQAVNEECQNSRNPGIANAVKKYFFEIVSVNNILEIGLGKGEREAISLAKERNIKTILLDDHKAIKKALNLDLEPITTSDILLIAKKMKLIPSVRSVLDRMIQTGEWLDENYYMATLRDADEM